MLAQVNSITALRNSIIPKTYRMLEVICKHLRVVGFIYRDDCFLCSHSSAEFPKVSPSILSKCRKSSLCAFASSSVYSTIPCFSFACSKLTRISRCRSIWKVFLTKKMLITRLASRVHIAETNRASTTLTVLLGIANSLSRSEIIRAIEPVDNPTIQVMAFSVVLEMNVSSSIRLFASSE